MVIYDYGVYICISELDFILFRQHFISYIYIINGIHSGFRKKKKNLILIYMGRRF